MLDPEEYFPQEYFPQTLIKTPMPDCKPPKQITEVKTYEEIMASITKRKAQDIHELKQRETSTLRDTFAGLAMQTLIQQHPHYSRVEIVTEAYGYSDMMLVAREAKVVACTQS